MGAEHPLILVTGATGYIGGRLVPRLLAMGYRVCCMVRDPARLQGRPWHSAVEVVAGDMLRPESLPAALQGADAAYYLVHSLAGGRDFPERDLTAARNFGCAARDAGTPRIIYLGGLGVAHTGLSEHLRSRQQTGEVLRVCGVPVTEFRASVIVGSGSISFEMVRYLTERLPLLVCPRWVYTRTQPIGIREVLEYLAAALSVPESIGRTIEIGGGGVVTFAEMMMTYAEVRGLKRRIVPVPLLTPRLSSHWVSLITPIPASIARPLIDGLRNESIVCDPSALDLFPHIRPVDYRTAVQRALVRIEARDIETSWTDALSTSQGDGPPVELATQEGIILERRQSIVPAPPERLYQVFTGLGGARGWLYMDWVWKIRGLIDRWVGGVGLRRGRRDPDVLRVGDALDFWRVEALEPGRLMRLRAEMKVPGTAWLQFEARPHVGDASLLVQTAFLDPKGLWGLIYWYALYPIHSLIFRGLIRHIARRAVAQQRGAKALPPRRPAP